MIASTATEIGWMMVASFGLILLAAVILQIGKM